MAERGEISCSNCAAACCKQDMAIPMTESEAYRHRRKMDLQRMVKARPFAQIIKGRATGPDGRPTDETTSIELARNTGLYALKADCGYLDGNSCSIYDDPHKPRACTEFEVASPACLDLRAARGIPIPTQSEPSQ